MNVAFVVILAFGLLALIAWGVNTLPEERWQMLAAVPVTNYGDGSWWDMPSNRHSQGAQLSFADGHVEYWRWKAPMIGVLFQTVSPAQMPDYRRVGSAMRIKLVDGLAD